MKKYKSYCKPSSIAAMNYHNSIAGNKNQLSFWDISKWPQWWESGAKDLEKSTPGKIITAPIRIPAKIIDVTNKSLDELPPAIHNAGLAIPIIAVSAVLLGAGFLAVKFKLFDKKENKTV